ncbi:MAG TPA: MBL fold metallo-hydrolase [Anaerolineales bacterium]|nr:lactamase [Anaerolineaceae bacterium]HJO91701.1 MBL fold metallo-hydrolase [Anaerolineales bacterium]|tara:strand:- start:82 stop:726 length:645 start_codon:yes stop_codon:yes gene_type:complete
MEIAWHGYSCFRLTERNSASIVTDPFNKSIGLASPRLKADVVTISHDAPGHSNSDNVKGARTITGPGEYEIGGAFITGVNTSSNKQEESSETSPNTAYVIDYDSASVCHLGDMNAIPSQTQIEALGTVDVLLVPVGGGKGLNAAQAAEIISLIEPSIVVPMHYRVGKVKVNLDPLSRFLKEMGLGKVNSEPNLKVIKSSLPEETQVRVLEPKTG